MITNDKLPWDLKIFPTSNKAKPFNSKFVTESKFSKNNQKKEKKNSYPLKIARSNPLRRDMKRSPLFFYWPCHYMGGRQWWNYAHIISQYPFEVLQIKYIRKFTATIKIENMKKNSISYALINIDKEKDTDTIGHKFSWFGPFYKMGTATKFNPARKVLLLVK